MLTQMNAFLASPKGKAVVLLIVLIVPMAMGVGTTVNNQFWYGMNELLLNSDVPSGIRHGLGIFGVVHAAVEGAIWGTVFGGPAGIIAGVTAGL